MNLRDRARRSLILVAALSVIFASGAFADNHDSDDFDVTVATVEGTRTLDVLAPGGGALSGLSLSGTSTQAPFLTHVTDTLYDNVGYTVSADLTRLYRHDGSWECANYLDSANLSIDYVAAAPDPTDIEATAQPIFDLVAEDLDLSSFPLVGGTLTVALDDVAGELIEYTEGELELLPNFPISVSSGDTGAFDNPAPHDGCDDAIGGEGSEEVDPEQTTPVVIQTGSNSGFEAAIEADLAIATLNTASDAIGSTPPLLDETALNGEIRSALSGLLSVAPNLIPSGLINEVRTNLDIDGVRLDLRQTGLYASMPKLVLRDELTGELLGGGIVNYQGTLTVTLVDED